MKLNFLTLAALAAGGWYFWDRSKNNNQTSSKQFGASLPIVDDLIPVIEVPDNDPQIITPPDWLPQPPDVPPALIDDPKLFVFDTQAKSLRDIDLGMFHFMPKTAKSDFIFPVNAVPQCAESLMREHMDKFVVVTDHSGGNLAQHQGGITKTIGDFQPGVRYTIAVMKPFNLVIPKGPIGGFRNVSI